jgi:hypothetical protein
VQGKVTVSRITLAEAPAAGSPSSPVVEAPAAVPGEAGIVHATVVGLVNDVEIEIWSIVEAAL